MSVDVETSIKTILTLAKGGGAVELNNLKATVTKLTIELHKKYVTVPDTPEHLPTPEDILILADFVQNAPHLIDLTIQTGKYNQNIDPLLEAVLNNESVIDLRVSYVTDGELIGTKHTKYIINDLIAKNVLKHLILYKVKIHVPKFMTAMATNTSITTLILTNNVYNIEEDYYVVHDFENVGEMLKVNTTLTSLQIYSTFAVRDRGASDIAKGLYNNTTLKELFLYNGSIESAGVSALADMLAVNTGLEKLNIDQNYFDQETNDKLEKALKYNTTLTSLTVKNGLRVDYSFRSHVRRNSHNQYVNSLTLIDILKNYRKK